MQTVLGRGMKLNRTKQCRNCPWRKDSNLSKIPGYKRDKHAALKKTISDGSLNISTLNIMACHESTEEDSQHCIGWVANQVGGGNNIGLRIAMMRCDQAKDIETFGEQFKTFEEMFR
jgi:hypothetical protein